MVRITGRSRTWYRPGRPAWSVNGPDRTGQERTDLRSNVSVATGHYFVDARRGLVHDGRWRQRGQQGGVGRDSRPEFLRLIQPEEQPRFRGGHIRLGLTGGRDRHPGGDMLTGP